jgi:hypothetical protein
VSPLKQETGTVLTVDAAGSTSHHPADAALRYAWSTPSGAILDDRAVVETYVMGKPMAVNLIKAGHQLSVFDLNQAAVGLVLGIVELMSGLRPRV